MPEPPAPFIVLDSTPLALLAKRAGKADGDRCRTWVAGHVRRGARFYVPEVIVYEVRRELLRLSATGSLAAVEDFVAAGVDRLIPLTSAALRLAAQLWADVRRQGRPTAADAALDVDVILAAQVPTAGWAETDVVVATSNRKHVGLFVPAAEWADI